MAVETHNRNEAMQTKELRTMIFSLCNSSNAFLARTRRVSFPKTLSRERGFR
jgi:hypothetical protein